MIDEPITGANFEILHKAIGTIGVPAVLLFLGAYFFFVKIAPPMVSANVEFLRATSATMREMSDTEKKMQESIDAMTKSFGRMEMQGTTDKQFAAEVRTEHARALEAIKDNSKKLDTVIQKVDK